ncbi:MAG: hypothetical protein HY927_12515 [Elusimicrobia bacterium]|nr:hypothetical protein [Elusimicrobiota bacterium]
MKADEVAAYFLGRVVGRIFSTIPSIIAWNNVAGVSSEEEARRLGGKLLVPTSGGDVGLNGLAKNANVDFNTTGIDSSASFQGGLIHWKEDQYVKDIMMGILGLKLPKNTAELVARLNSLDNDWIRGVRGELAQSRLKNAPRAPGGH